MILSWLFTAWLVVTGSAAALLAVTVGVQEWLARWRRRRAAAVQSLASGTRRLSSGQPAAPGRDGS